MINYIDITPEIKTAIREGKAVVALESSVISHGLPWPDNLQTALDIQQSIRSEGGIPATIALLNGRIKVGLDEKEITFLAQPGSDIRKCSRRDLSALVTQKLHATTTVASTMIIAHHIGISVFATGGIGGVHREGQQTFDISADLDELARTPIAVVCSGAKLILNLPLTMEYLETKGVPVIGFDSDELAAFFCRSSGLPVDYRCNTPDELAELIDNHLKMKLGSGLIISNPVPYGEALDRSLIEKCIHHALAEAKEQEIIGKAVTPFLLKKIREQTDNLTLQSNIALIKSNARLATKIALALSSNISA